MSDDNRYVQHREWWDIPMILFVGALTYVLHTLWSFECIHPAVWGELAVSAGLRPPEEPFPGLYRLMVAGLFKIFSPGAVLDALPYLGRVVMSLSAMLVYLVFRDMLPTTLRIRIHMARIASLVGGLCAFMAALLFVCADPIWRAGVTFSPVSLFLLLTVVSLCLFFRFVQRGSIPSLYVCCALVGMISAESSLGFLMAGLIVLGVLLAVRWARDPDVPFVNPLVDALMQVVVFKRLTYIWAFFFMLTIGLNICGFIQMGGMEATGHDGVLGLLFEYLRCGWEATHGAAMGSGWLFIVVFCVVPLVFVLKLLPSAWDDDKFLPWSVGVVYAAMGAVAMSQLSGARVLWFWTWIDSHRAMMPSDTLLAFVLLFDVAVVTFTLAVFGVDAICRNYRRIAKQKFPESMLSTIPAQMAESLGRARALRKRLFWLIVITLPIVVVPWRSLPTERGIAHFISAMVDETMKETEGCEMMFTDGSFDCLMELESFRRGRPMVCMSLMQGNTLHAHKLRQRVAKDDEDRALLETDTASALRSWVETKPERLTNSAVQIGFEMWRRVKKSFPPCSGLVALPGGVSDEERARALKVCTELGNAAADFAEKYKVDKVPDRELRRKFPFVLWRLSRLAQIRSHKAEEEGKRDEAIHETAFAEELDSVNKQVQKMRTDMNWIKYQNGGQLSPREGLVIGLARADFALAGRYAGPVLKADPDDPRANFALGMMFLQESQLSRAEQHFERCLKRRPDEPAVLNNLAIVQLKLGKLQEAEAHIRRALEKHSNIPELGKTLDRIKKAQEAKKKR